MTVLSTAMKYLLFWALSLSLLLTACENDDDDTDTDPQLSPSVALSVSSVDFEEIEKGLSAQEHVIITAEDLTDNISLEVKGDLFSISDASSGAFSNTLNFRAADLNASENVTIYLKFESTGVNASGTFEGTLVVKSELGENTITLKGSVVVLNPGINLSAEELDFVGITVGNEEKRSFTLSAADLKEDVTITVSDGAFSISEAEEGIFGKSLNITAEDMNAADYEVFVRFLPGEGGTFEGTVTIASELEDKTVMLSGSAVLAPNMNLSTAAMDFGEVSPGASSTKSFNITASSLTSDLTVTVVGGVFSISDAEGGTYESMMTISAATINAQGSMDVFVRYIPDAEGAFNGSVTVTSELGDEVVTLTGTGVVNTFQWAENFDYASDLPVLGRPADRAAALADYENWVDLKGGTRALLSGLIFTDYPGSGVGNALGYGGADTEIKNYVRTIKDPLAGVAGEVQYVSFMFSIVSAPSGGSTPLLLATWQDKANPGAKWNDRFIVKDVAGDIKFGVVDGGGAGAAHAVLADKTITPNQLYIIVIKKEIVDGPLNDQTSLFILESIPVTEPAADAVSISAQENIPDAIVLTGNHQFEGTIDGIRLAKSWNDLFSE